METLTVQDIKAIFDLLTAIMNEKKDWLIELDGVMGDGDLGLTMSTGFSKAAEALKNLSEQDMGKILAKAGMTIAQSVPSTMGTLLATGFMKGGKAVEGRQELNLAGFTIFMNGFVEGIMARGKAKPGDKTIIDSLYPAVQALKVANASNQSLKAGLKSAYDAAIEGVEATKAMISQHGRAAYYQEKSVGKQDPGATVGMLLLKGFSDYVG